MTDPTPDPRPRPQYGEYSDAPPPVAAPEPLVEHAPAPPTAAAPGAGPSVGAIVRNRWDRMLTVFLLALGTFDVVLNFTAFANFANTISISFAQLGVEDAFSSTELAAGVGLAANMIRVVLLAVAIVISVRRLRAGRITFWVPLTAGAIAAVALVVCFSIVLANDPASLEYIDSLQ